MISDTNKFPNLLLIRSKEYTLFCLLNFSEKLVSIQPMYEMVWRYNVISKQLVYVQKHNIDKNDRNIKIKCVLKLK